MAARITLKTVNDELARLGHVTRLAKAAGYFYFQFGEAADWLDRTVSVPTINSLTVTQWIEEFRRLQQVNQQLTGRSLQTQQRPRKQRPAQSRS
jgi:hypothetical protein